MPIYDFHCNQCESKFEFRATFQEKERGLNPKCPRCSGDQTRQILSTGLFIRTGAHSNGPGRTNFCGPNTGNGCCG